MAKVTSGNSEIAVVSLHFVHEPARHVREPAGARFRARFNRATTLYPVGPRIRTKRPYNAPRQQPAQPQAPKRDGNGRLKGGHSRPALPLDGRRGSKPQFNPVDPVLGPEASAELRDRLVTELAS